MEIKNVFTNPSVKLDDNPALCTGSTRLLNAGNGFTNYQWNNGSINSSIVVNQAGTYFVNVTDNNGCRGGDTVTIQQLLPLPSAFLPIDTAVCSYGSIELKPAAAYASYLWSTNATAASIKITKPGLYWLQVQDPNKCTGRDTILVNPKQCMYGFYIPNGFSPNNDGVNDAFRPLLFGNVKKFEFIVYNRWGQIIFRTGELEKGWDGKLNGITQDSGTYVWICKYQLEGEMEKVEKGTVMLIR